MPCTPTQTILLRKRQKRAAKLTAPLYFLNISETMSFKEKFSEEKWVLKRYRIEQYETVTFLRRISCHGRNYSQPYFFKRNQSSDNRSHRFGTKFLLKKLSASDFSYERKFTFSHWKLHKDQMKFTYKKILQ